jgi:NADPH:quinone reductase-like Zn-dependent oxidoreductase
LGDCGQLYHCRDWKTTRSSKAAIAVGLTSAVPVRSMPDTQFMPGQFTNLLPCGKRVMVTGASRGIGFAVATMLAGAGCDVVMVDYEQGEAMASVGALRSNGTQPHYYASKGGVNLLMQGSALELGCTE